MRIAVALLLGSLTSVSLLAFSACNGATTSTPDSGGSTTPTDDGAVCSCATPDCLPSCSDLPPCKLVCTTEGTRNWVDPCGAIQYTQVCPSGCLDAAADAACE